MLNNLPNFLFHNPYYIYYSVQKIDKKNYISKGIYEVLNETSIRVTELPIGKWTDDYKKYLDSLIPDTSKKSKSLETELNKKKKPKKLTIEGKKWAKEAIKDMKEREK